MDGPRSPLSPQDASGEPGISAPDSPFLSVTARRALLTRGRDSSTMVAPHPVSARSVAQNSEGGTRNKIKSLSLRGSTLSDYELWQFAIREMFLSNDVSHLVDHGFKEVTIDMVTFLHPEVGTGEAASLLTQYQLQYQSDQRVLFRLIQESVDFAGPHQAQDMRYLQRQFTRSDLRDGLGFWKWIATFFDQTSFDAHRESCPYR